jgi:hypothetical protein
VFVTQNANNGNLGGIAGADNVCQTAANNAGIAGTFKAWLATQAQGPAVTLTPSSLPYVRVDGVKVADNWTDLIDGSLDAPIRVSELGNLLASSSLVWTGATQLGQPISTLQCADWSTASSDTVAVVGNAAEQGSGFSVWLNRPCDQPQRLYCIQQ